MVAVNNDWSGIIRLEEFPGSLFSEAGKRDQLCPFDSADGMFVFLAAVDESESRRLRVVLQEGEDFRADFKIVPGRQGGHSQAISPDGGLSQGRWCREKVRTSREKQFWS